MRWCVENINFIRWMAYTAIRCVEIGVFEPDLERRVNEREEEEKEETDTWIKRSNCFPGTTVGFVREPLELPT